MSSAVSFGLGSAPSSEGGAVRDRLRRIMAECLEDAAAMLLEDATPVAAAASEREGRIPPLAVGGGAVREDAAASAGKYPPDVVALARDLFQARMRAEGLA